MSQTAGFHDLPDYQTALGRVLDGVAVLGVESLPLEQACGRVLREAIVADRDQPPFDRAAMDGFAVRSDQVNAGGSLDIVATLAAGARLEDTADLTTGVVRIATGAAVPDSFDAVIPIEQASVDGQQVRFTVSSIEPGQHIHRRGSDTLAGNVVIAGGKQLSPQHIGIAAIVGAAALTVSRLPRITLLSSGNEVQPSDTPTAQLEPQQIRNSNAPMVKAVLESMGLPLFSHVHVADEPEQLRAAAREALSHSNLVLTTGGVSVGHRDFLPSVWQGLGLDELVHGVAIQPGKPVLVCQPKDEGEKLVIGLPGNPVSVLVMMHLFVWPVLRKMMGLDATLPWHQVALSGPIKASNWREIFRTCRKTDGKRGPVVEVIAWHGSGDLVHTADADGLVRLPRQDDPVAAGTLVDFLPLLGSV